MLDVAVGSSLKVIRDPDLVVTAKLSMIPRQQVQTPQFQDLSAYA